MARPIISCYRRLRLRRTARPPRASRARLAGSGTAPPAGAGCRRASSGPGSPGPSRSTRSTDSPVPPKLPCAQVAGWSSRRPPVPRQGDQVRQVHVPVQVRVAGDPDGDVRKLDEADAGRDVGRAAADATLAKACPERSLVVVGMVNSSVGRSCSGAAVGEVHGQVGVGEPGDRAQGGELVVIRAGDRLEGRRRAANHVRWSASGWPRPGVGGEGQVAAHGHLAGGQTGAEDGGQCIGRPIRQGAGAGVTWTVPVPVMLLTGWGRRYPATACPRGPVERPRAQGAAGRRR